jgi:hypothetical protein
VSGSGGAGSGESLRHFPVRPKDCLIGDRGYAQAAGIGHVQRQGGYCIVRHNAQNLPVEDEAGAPVDVLRWLRGLTQPGAVGSCTAHVPVDSQHRVCVRLCAVRKSPEAVVASERKVRRRA